MVQEIIVAIIGILVIGWIIYKVRLFFITKAEDKSYCGCSSCHCNINKKER